MKGQRYLFRRGDMLSFRRAVPERAREAFGGRREVVVSFGSCSVAAARHLVARELEKFEERLARATGAATPIETIALARRHVPSSDEIDEAVRAWLVERHRRMSVGDGSTPEKRAAAQATLLELDVYSDAVAKGLAFGVASPLLTTQWLAESLIERNGWQVEPGSELERHLLRTAGRGQVEASAWQSQDINGEPRAILDARFSVEQRRMDIERQRERKDSKAVSLLRLLDEYVAQATLAAATVKAWRRQVRAFTTFVGHDDANRISRADIVAWRKHLLTHQNADDKVLSAKTVKDTYLSVLKTVFIWGAADGTIREDPTKGVKVIVQRKNVLRERGLDDVEAGMILAATLANPSARLSAERALAQRWVPWICAYTGARVNEITQLRAEDVSQIRGVWTIRITPEAGSVKDRKARIVALHPHLVDQGFPAVAAGRTGPIFFDPKRHRGGSDGNPQAKKVGEHLARWVRSVGVSDPSVQPNHGWRHRFKSQARLADMDPEVRDAIQGHVPRTEGESYGDTLPEVMLRELAKLPRYLVDRPS